MEQPRKADKGPRRSRHLKKNYRYDQIMKLVNRFKLITINGSPASETKDIAKTVKQATLDPKPVYLAFIIVPSDPDFPFDLDTLQINLVVPKEKGELASIRVLNDDIPRGYAINVERGFTEIAKLANSTDTKVVIGEEEDAVEISLVNGKTLLSQILTLDRYLEVFLKQEKRQTIKIIKTKKKSRDTTPQPAPKSTPQPQPVPQEQPVPIDKAKRDKLVNELKLKLKGDIKLFHKSARAIKYKIDLPVNCKEDVPENWLDKGKLELLLTVPPAYPNSNLRLEFLKKTGSPKQETNLVQNFNSSKFDESIVASLNYLSNNLHVFCESSTQFSAYTSLANSYTAHQEVRV